MIREIWSTVTPGSMLRIDSFRGREAERVSELTNDELRVSLLNAIPSAFEFPFPQEIMTGEFEVVWRSEWE